MKGEECGTTGRVGSLFQAKNLLINAFPQNFLQKNKSQNCGGHFKKKFVKICFEFVEKFPILY